MDIIHKNVKHLYSHDRISSRELQASMTVLTLAILQCLVYIPVSVGCMFYCAANASVYIQVTFPLYWASVTVLYKFVNSFFTVSEVKILLICLRNRKIFEMFNFFAKR